MLQEIPVIRLRSRSSSSSSSSSDSRARSRSRSRRRSYSTDEDIEIIEDSTATSDQTPRKESEKDSNSPRKSSEAQNTEDADGDILEVEVIKSNTDVRVHSRSSSRDRLNKRRKSRDCPAIPVRCSLPLLRADHTTDAVYVNFARVEPYSKRKFSKTCLSCRT